MKLISPIPLILVSLYLAGCTPKKQSNTLNDRSKKLKLLKIDDAWASTELNTEHSAKKAIDGDLSTRWESFHQLDPSHLKIMLDEKNPSLQKIEIVWEAANASSYKIEGSNNDRNWTTIATKENGTFGDRTDSIIISGDYRFLRIQGVKRPEQNTWGYSIKEIMVFGETSKASNAKPSQCQRVPYHGTYTKIPGTLQIEDYDIGCQHSLSYSDTTPENQGNSYRQDGVDIGVHQDGKHVVGWLENGEWLEYTINVEQTSEYTLDFDVATTTDYGELQILINGERRSNIKFPNTHGWDNWLTYSSSRMRLSKGIHVLRFAVVSNGFSVDSVHFRKESGQTIPKPAVNPIPKPQVEPKPEPRIEPKPEPRIEPKDHPKVAIKVMTYNLRIENAGGDTENKNWQNRKEFIGLTVKRHVDEGVTLIGLQEASGNQKNHLLGTLGSEWQDWNGILFHTTKVKQVSTHSHTLPAEHQWGERKAYWSVFKHIESGKEFVFSNSHWSTKSTKRLESAKFVHGQLSEITQDGTYPLIYVGDLNATLGSEPINKIIEPYQTSKGSKKLTNFFEDSTFAFWNLNLDRQLDYIFGVDVEKTSCKKDVETYGRDLYPSDHVPIICDIKL